MAPQRAVLSTVESLRLVGINPSGVDFALPTHLHWDHVSGLLDLPGLEVHTPTIEWDWAMAGEVAPVGGVRPSLRNRPVERFDVDGPPLLTFTHSRDFFGDGAVTVVALPGHTPGSLGVLVRTPRGYVLLAGDAIWHGEQARRLRQKGAYPGVLADADRPEAFRTVHRLFALDDRVRVVATHDHVAVSDLMAGARSTG